MEVGRGKFVKDPGTDAWCCRVYVTCTQRRDSTRLITDDRGETAEQEEGYEKRKEGIRRGS